MLPYAGADLARSFRIVRKNTLQIAQEIPADQYDYRATPATRSVAELLAHITAASRWPRHMHGDVRAMMFNLDEYLTFARETAAYEKTLTGRASILTALEADGDKFASWLESIPDDALRENVAFAPPLTPSSKTRFEMLLGVKEHEMHHRAQLMLIERLLGIVPHLTRARQSR